MPAHHHLEVQIFEPAHTNSLARSERTFTFPVQPPVGYPRWLCFCLGLAVLCPMNRCSEAQTAFKHNVALVASPGSS